jgi:NADH:ubiquinone oxidoreductase subunit E
MKSIYVCIGSACHLKGSYDVINRLQEMIEKYNLENCVEVEAVFCLGHCIKGVSVQLNGNDTIFSVTPDNVDDFFIENVLPMYVENINIHSSKTGHT